MINKLTKIQQKNIKVYLNGNLDGTGSNTLGNSNMDLLVFGGPTTDSYAGARMFYGNVYYAAHYNRVLTASEISQNFNALRGRYGI